MKTKCVICEEKYEGYGHNARPIKIGKCCNDCNMEVVLPSRIRQDLGIVINL